MFKRYAKNNPKNPFLWGTNYIPYEHKIIRHEDQPEVLQEYTKMILECRSFGKRGLFTGAGTTAVLIERSSKLKPELMDTTLAGIAIYVMANLLLYVLKDLPDMIKSMKDQEDYYSNINKEIAASSNSEDMIRIAKKMSRHSSESFPEPPNSNEFFRELVPILEDALVAPILGYPLCMRITLNLSDKIRSLNMTNYGTDKYFVSDYNAGIVNNRGDIILMKHPESYLSPKQPWLKMKIKCLLWKQWLQRKKFEISPVRKREEKTQLIPGRASSASL